MQEPSEDAVVQEEAVAIAVKPETFDPNVDNLINNHLINNNTINDTTIVNDNICNEINANDIQNEQIEDDDEIIVVCSPPRKQDTCVSPCTTPQSADEYQPQQRDDGAPLACHYDAQISFKSEVAVQREAKAAAKTDPEPVQEIDVVNDKPPNHDQVQKLNDFDSAKAVNRYILQTNNSNIHSSSINHINNKNNDATAPATINEEVGGISGGGGGAQCNTNAAAANNSHDTSGIAQADKHNSTASITTTTAASSNNNNNYHQQQQNNATAAAAAAATGASVESVDYATLGASDLCSGGTMTVQGVDSEQIENFVVTSGYIQECGYYHSSVCIVRTLPSSSFFFLQQPLQMHSNRAT